MPTSDLAIIRDEIAELRSLIKSQPKRKQKDLRPLVNMRVSHDELAQIDAVCDQRGVTRAELLRHCLNQVIGLEITERFEVHPQFRKMQARKKPDRDRFKDGKTDATQIERADASRDAARQAVRLGIEARRIMADQGDATLARNVPGLLAETVKKF